MAPTIGGVATFLRDFVRLSPPGFQIDVVGATSDRDARPVGRWQSWDAGDRQARFLPLVLAAPPDRLSRIPTSLRFTLALAVRRSRLRTRGRTLQFHRPEVPLAFLGHRGPRLEVVHIDVQGGPQATRWRRIPGIYRRLEDLTIPRMDRVFVANRPGVQLYRDRYPGVDGRVQFLPSWYDDAIFRPGAAATHVGERRAIADGLGLPAAAPGERWILFVGRLEIEKDPALLIDAYVALHARSPEPIRLIVAGEGSLRAASEQRAKAAGVGGNVHFLGARPRDEVARLMRASDALVVTSRSEGGGPRVVLEALGSGLPVVSTVVGEVEGVIRTGVNGWLAPDRTAAALAEAVRRVLELPREPAAAAAVAAVQSLTARRVLDALYDAHRELAAPR
ncbi:MAG: hypothetical protein QOH61_1133 [Chloroflexota bacterium]|nr:hypothetical protein [Chloroflexota bacterium]